MSWKTPLLGLLISVAGAASWVFLLDNIWIRSTAAPNLAAMGLGVVICAWSVARKPRVASITCLVLGGLVAVAFAVSLFGLGRLPTPTTVSIGGRPPEFALSNHAGRTVRLSDRYGRGPVLLVFYRGHW